MLRLRKKGRPGLKKNGEVLCQAKHTVTLETTPESALGKVESRNGAVAAR